MWTQHGWVNVNIWLSRNLDFRNSEICNRKTWFGTCHYFFYDYHSINHSFLYFNSILYFTFERYWVIISLERYVSIVCKIFDLLYSILSSKLGYSHYDSVNQIASNIIVFAYLRSLFDSFDLFLYQIIEMGIALINFCVNLD